jgi:PQQ-dependent dehydrogenase (s-GDH family)
MRSLLAVFAVVTAAAVAVGQDTARRSSAERFEMRIVAAGLDAPWEIAWGADEQLWVTERRGRRIVRIDPSTGARRATAVPQAHQGVSQDGLLGLAFHPDFLRGGGPHYLYVAYTYDDAPGTSLGLRMAITRYEYDRTTRNLASPTDILTGLPAHDDHLGGRLAVGPDRKLYLTIGDQGSNFGGNRCNPNRAQELPTAADVQARNWSSYQGKILRVDLDGSIPADNPAIDGVRSHVFSYGHRNPLGLAFGPDGLLYETEHGPSSDDEVNLIEGGRNYGWPNVAGYRDDKAYSYANWSASKPQPCSALGGAADRIPPSVPATAETAWWHPRFTPPLRTFFTVDTGTDLGSIGTATIAPGGLDVYAPDGASSRIADWNRSLLVLSLIRGTVYRLPLAPDGRSVQAEPVELLRSANRYRDIALGPDGRTIYLATDISGPIRQGGGPVSQALANPGAILEFKYAPGP